MKILHLSDTTLSGSPIRIVNMINKYSEHKARHITWLPRVYDRVFPTDLVGSEMPVSEIMEHLEWADVIHYHNRYKRQQIFKKYKIEPPKKPSVIQIHSPRESEDFSEEVSSGIPLAVIAQYHVRQWKEAKFVVPNVVDINDIKLFPATKINPIPKVSYAPSNTNAKGWDDKGYGQTSAVLKRMDLAHQIKYQLIIKKPWLEAMQLKQSADIGIDEMITGSYHLSSLEYLSMGCATFAYIDPQTEAAIKSVTHAEWLPWINTPISGFKSQIEKLIKDRDTLSAVKKNSRSWMEGYWSPKVLLGHYIRMYMQL